jgi:hypothetical protein
MRFSTLTECVRVTVDLDQNQVNIVTSDDYWHDSKHVHHLRVYTFWPVSSQHHLYIIII